MFYSIEDFDFNGSWGVSIIPYRDQFILHIDDVYKNPLRVYEFLKSSPIRSHRLLDGGEHKGNLIYSIGGCKNGKEFYDGQLKLDNRLSANRCELYDRIIQFYQLDPESIGEFPPISVFNQFRLVKDYPGNGKFYSPHTDNKINCCTYLNPDCGSSSGTMLYKAVDKDWQEGWSDNEEHMRPWKDSSLFLEDLCILSKFNSMVVFPGTIPHGQIIIDNRFKEKTRFTEAVFF